MILSKRNLLLQILILCYTLTRTCAIECKVCGAGNPSCLFEYSESRVCENEDDVCYSWFYRTASAVGAQRNCISRTSPVYHLLKTIIEGKHNGCIKRTRGFDCFAICSTDLCN